MQWSDFALSELEVAPWMLIKNSRVYPDELKIPPEILAPSMQWESSRAQRILIKGLEGKNYLVGNAFSLADIHISVALLMHLKVGLSIAPVLGTYLGRTLSRPAVARLIARGEMADVSALFC
ncbi:hypothetical protein KJI95_02140 [Shewanella sp. JM162201]|uniref:Glutathione S-transferase C-terminal domain-containing protein n=1 Tax=Shewanella jiangmenensis TaxID=2837387 RepID=A0ABS5V154_9GAMM|nr:glutathione binding-like protein [Shewanella jiangmenensis]MBT1443329.1 hypothetical protein [Shewanella jiangmenensis]